MAYPDRRPEHDAFFSDPHPASRLAFLTEAVAIRPRGLALLKSKTSIVVGVCMLLKPNSRASDDEELFDECARVLNAGTPRDERNAGLEAHHVRRAWRVWRIGNCSESRESYAALIRSLLALLVLERNAGRYPEFRGLTGADLARRIEKNYGLAASMERAHALLDSAA